MPNQTTDEERNTEWHRIFAGAVGAVVTAHHFEVQAEGRFGMSLRGNRDFPSSRAYFTASHRQLGNRLRPIINKARLLAV